MSPPRPAHPAATAAWLAAFFGGTPPPAPRPPGLPPSVLGVVPGVAYFVVKYGLMTDPGAFGWACGAAVAVNAATISRGWLRPAERLGLVLVVDLVVVAWAAARLHAGR